MRKVVTAAAVVLLASIFLAAPAQSDEHNGPLRLGAHLTGEREVPGPGDPDGLGRAQMKVNLADNLFCYHVDVRFISQVVGGHIHIGHADESGPIVIDLNMPANGQKGCVPADPDLLRHIIQHPQQYYLNIHTTEYPAGAIRDQLSQRS